MSLQSTSLLSKNQVKPHTYTLIAQDSAELAHFCGIDPGIRHRMDEEKEARALAAHALQMRTERIREANERAAKVREQHSSVASTQ